MSELKFHFAPKPVCRQVCFGEIVLRLNRRERRVLHHLWEHDVIHTSEISENKMVARVTISSIRRELREARAPFIIKFQRENGVYVLQPCLEEEHKIRLTEEECLRF